MRERERQRGNAGERERIISKTKIRQNRTGGQHQMAVKTLWPMRKERERKTKNNIFNREKNEERPYALFIAKNGPFKKK